MKKLLILTAALALAACSSTWSGVKEDTSHNVSRTKEAVKEGGNAVGRALPMSAKKLKTPPNN